MKANIEIIKSIYSGDAEQNVKSLQGILAPEFEWKEAEGFPYTGVFHSFEEVLNTLFAPLATEWVSFLADAEAFYDAGETIVATGYYRATYKKTNRTMRARFVHIWMLKNEKIVKYIQCADTAKVWEAME